MIFAALLLKIAPVFGATACSSKFFFIPNWWEFLPTQPKAPSCDITFTFPGDIWALGLAVLDILLRLAGFIAVISIIIAGFMYISSLGNPEKGVSARKRLQNSLIGLGIVIVATALVTFIGNNLG